MTRGPERLRISCPHCSAEERVDRAELAARLRRLGMLKRDDERDVRYLLQLAKGSRAGIECSTCGSGGVKVDLAEAADEWDGPRRACAACGAAIPPERLQLLPDAELCAACQQRIDGGQSPDQHDDFCPRCGTRMTVRPRRGRGIAGYEMICPACRR
jgi:hypothetical protein